MCSILMTSLFYKAFMILRVTLRAERAKLRLWQTQQLTQLGSQRFECIAIFTCRFGHSQVNTHLWRYEEDGTMSSYGHVSLRHVFFSPERVKREGGLDPLFRGAVRQAAQEVDLKVCSDRHGITVFTRNTSDQFFELVITLRSEILVKSKTWGPGCSKKG